MPALLYTCQGAKHSGVIEDFSMRGLGLTTATSHGLQPGESVTVALADDDVEHTFPGTVVSTRGNRLCIALHELPIAKQREYVRCTFASTEGWVDSATSIDRPLASFAEVLLVAVTGYVRVLQVFSMGLFAWRGGGQSRSL